MDPYHARVAPEPYTPLHTSEFHDDGATSFEEASQDRGQSGPPKMDSSMSAADELLQSTEVEQVASESEAVAPNNTVSGPKESDQDVSDDPDDDGGVGLFGSDSESEAPETKRKLDDKELDSGDDEGRNDRVEDEANDYDDEAAAAPQQSATILDVDLGRHANPRPSDGQLHLLKLPNFVGIEPKAFDYKNFQPPETDHHSSTASSTFSASKTSDTTIRWRHSPSDPSKLQSNCRVLRWSDGSMTLQFASNPLEQYLLPSKQLSGESRAPPKPSSSRAPKAPQAYDPRLESHTYLAAPHEHASLFRVTNHVTSSLTVQSTAEENDDAVIRLQESLATAVKGNKTAADGSVGVISISEDPELAKKKAEVAEREKIRAQRRRQNQEDRERDRANRVLGRSGLHSSRGVGAGGLSVGALEDEGGMGLSRPSKVKASRRPRRRNSEYSDDEEDYRNRGRTKEDDYDVDDGFLVGSDEEEEVAPDETEEEEELDDEAPKPTKKEEKATEEPGPSDTPAAAGGARMKKRRVVAEDDDDEE